MMLSEEMGVDVFYATAGEVGLVLARTRTKDKLAAAPTPWIAGEDECWCGLSRCLVAEV